ncbi:MAG: hypothetical protein ACREHG_02415 [Candidatus Saccharimonadales bacterium]
MKTLIANLGVPGKPAATPAALTRLEIDGETASDITSMHLAMDASHALPAVFRLHRRRLIGGKEWESDEINTVLNLSVIIEYEEAK